MEQGVINFFHDYGGALCVLVGLYSIGGAVMGWSWFVNNWRARKVAGRTGGYRGMRIFYFVLGLGFFSIGVASIWTGISVLYLILMAPKDPLSIIDLL